MRILISETAVVNRKGESMSIKINSIAMLKKHIDGVMERADHHAQQVYKVVLPLVGLVVWKASDIDARTHEGKAANMIWFTTASGARYALVFNHEQRKIDIRDRSQQGNNLLSIDNNTPLDDLIAFFEKLQ